MAKALRTFKSLGASARSLELEQAAKELYELEVKPEGSAGLYTTRLVTSKCATTALKAGHSRKLHQSVARPYNSGRRPAAHSPSGLLKPQVELRIGKTWQKI